MKLSAAANLEVPAYLEISKRGYDVTRRSDSINGEVWSAHHGSSILEAESPIQLLGLIALIEARGEDCHSTDDETELFLATFYPQGK